MHRFALIVLLFLVAGISHAGTFELSDPAADMYKEREEWDEREAELQRQKNAVCTLDAKTDRCYCIDREHGQPVPMERDECLARAPTPLPPKQEP